MTDKEYGKIVARNLKAIAYERGKTQKDICSDLNLSKSTVSCWFTGARVPKMSMIDQLARYFGCTRADIMDENPPKKERLSADVEEVARLLQQLNHDDLIEIRGEIKGILRSYGGKESLHA